MTNMIAPRINNALDVSSIFLTWVPNHSGGGGGRVLKLHLFWQEQVLGAVFILYVRLTI